MARRGRKRQLEAESLYWQLILSGIGTVEACREVGIGRKTGYRWRVGPKPCPRAGKIDHGCGVVRGFDEPRDGIAASILLRIHGRGRTPDKHAGPT